MDSRRIRNLRNSFDRNSVDKQFDKIVETGRQFVDGVSGTRPGQRRNSDFQGLTSKNVKKVGKWVSEKVDLFFDEENDNWDDKDNIGKIKTFTRELSSFESSEPYFKRPLEALSLRQSKNVQIKEQKKLPYSKEDNNQDWPNELDFKVDRWQRSLKKENDKLRDNDTKNTGVLGFRNLPRSSRRKRG